MSEISKQDSMDFEPIWVRDRGRRIAIRSFEELKHFLRPPVGTRPIGVALQVADAETDEEKKEAVRAFRAWARVAGRLDRIGF
jgi:hypothetical protein